MSSSLSAEDRVWFRTEVHRLKLDIVRELTGEDGLVEWLRERNDDE